MSPKSKAQNKREITKTIRHLKSSPEARRLIDMALKHCGNERDAARYLGLPNHGQLHAMKIGKIHDTPAMLACIRLRKAQARRAYNRVFYSMNGKHQPTMVDAVIALRAIQRNEDANIVMLKALLKAAIDK